MIYKWRARKCKTLHYIEYLVFLNYTVTGCVSACAFAALFGISLGI